MKSRLWLKSNEISRGQVQDLTKQFEVKHNNQLCHRDLHQAFEEHNITNSYDEIDVSHDAAKQALMAIYQAGKPDNLFHVRAPSTAALESMLAVLASNTAQTTYCHHHNEQALRQRPVQCCTRRPCRDNPIKPLLCRRVSFSPNMVLPPNNVPNDSETKPVKVNVECAPNTDTFVSLRVRSVPA